MKKTLCLLFMATGMICAHAQPAASPDFARHPAQPYRGAVHLPDFKGQDKAFASFRTRIRDGMKNGPSFAGRLSIISFGCGTDCRAVITGDVSTGRVYDFPISGEEFAGISLDYRLDSTLITARWNNFTTRECQQEQFVWKKQQFSSLGRKTLGPSEVCERLAQ